MKAAIRRFHSPDVDDLKRWFPAEPECFGFLLQVLVGPGDGEGEESFDFVVCSPEWLRRKYGDDAIVLGRHYILLFIYDFDRVKKAIEAIVAKATGNNWHEVASKIACYGQWEFEDYQE
jgi:hypothetical protein